VEKDYVPPEDETLDERLEETAGKSFKRDDWMVDPSAVDVEYVQRNRQKEEKSMFVPASGVADQGFKTRQDDVFAQLDRTKEARFDKTDDSAVQREVDYEFGDKGSSWRMTKLKGIYRIAEEQGKTIEEVALDRYGDLWEFDAAREEEIELDRRKMYGKDYVGKIKPSGDLYEERRLEAGIHRPPRVSRESPELPQEEIVPDPQPAANTVTVDQTTLNKMKARMMKAKMKGAPNAAELETEYNAAAAGFSNRGGADVVVLNAMDNRMLAGGRKGEVLAIDNKRGRERGTVKENDDMSLDDMVRQERRTKGQNEGMLLAEKIGKDAKFDVSLNPGPFPSQSSTDVLRMTLNILTRMPLSSPLAHPNPPSTFAPPQ
jgi:hypothetical protein